MADLSRDRIVACAQDLVRAEGIGALGLRRIARELGVTAPALYSYVDDVEDLMRAVAEAQFRVLADRFDSVDTRSPEDTIRAHSRAYVEFALSDPELFKVMVRYPPDVAGGGTDHELPAATKAFMAATDPLIAGMDAGIFRRQDPVQAALAVWAAVHGCATVVNMGFDFDDATVARLIDDVIDLVIAGLTAT